MQDKATPKPIQKRYDQKSFKPNQSLKVANPKIKKNGGYSFVCSKPGHYAPQCRRRVKQDTIRNAKPPKPRASFVKGDDDVIIAMIS